MIVIWLAGMDVRIQLVLLKADGVVAVLQVSVVKILEQAVLQEVHVVLDIV
jgi:hypothetical protein